ncbi:CocE/NonD family hydrolase [Sciscionella marina]|uniref:CocE/NonD family hydrolase n=1 Tax=Sciscionella marina TaxID=508770 RepID=UPI00037C9EF1|nr:CocE/NonD family hydrolase [Sciscionella marina]
MSLASHLVERFLRLPAPHTREVNVHRDQRIPMPDGAVLLADHWTPAHAPGELPTVLVRCPYGRRGAMIDNGIGRVFAERGFQVLVVSTRGTFGSGGEFAPQVNEREDGLAVLDWLEQQPWYDGRVVLFGPSYLGFTQWAIAVDAPQVKAMVPQVTSARLTIGFTRPYSLDGLFRWSVQTATQEQSFAVLRSRLRERAVVRAMNTAPLGEADLRVLGRRWPFFAETLAHGPDDPHWARGDLGATVEEVRIPASFVAGWYDLFAGDQLEEYRRLVGAGTPARLTVGPWVHGAMGGIRAALREGLDWAGAHARGEQPAQRAPVRLFVMGQNRWRDFESWPPPGYSPTPYHLHGDGRLGTEQPEDNEPSRYRYDPADPTPSVGGPLLTARKGAFDQRKLEERPDVLTFSTAPLTAELEVIGEVTAKVWLRSSRPDTDVFVRLCDVDRRGHSTNICDALVNVRPDGITPVELRLSPTAYRFRIGHRIRVQVSSGAHPRFARNPGSGEPLATALSLHPADQELFHDREHPSTVTLPQA